MSNSEPKQVSWTIFVWTVGIVTVLLVGMFSIISSLQTKVDASEKDNVEIKIQLSKIQTDILWIRENLSGRK